MKTYTFYISLPEIEPPIWRKIELAADQSLAVLHLAIQKAFEFDNDHLYSFFMSGEAWDRSTEYNLPNGTPPWDTGNMSDESDENAEDGEPRILGFGNLPVTDLENLTPKEYEQLLQKGSEKTGIPVDMIRSMVEMFQDMYDMGIDPMFDEDEGGDARFTKIGDLDLKIGQEFLYLFDYGDEWRFKIRVYNINTDAPERDYPHIAEAVGEAPEQYRFWDDDGDYDDYDEDNDDENEWFVELGDGIIEVVDLPMQALGAKDGEAEDEAPPIEITPVVKADITPELRQQALERCTAFAANTLKPIVNAELTVKWQGRFLYISAPQQKTGAKKPSIVSFTRMEYAGADRSDLFEKYKDGWYAAYQFITLEDCLQIIGRDTHFRP